RLRAAMARSAAASRRRGREGRVGSCESALRLLRRAAGLRVDADRPQPPLDLPLLFELGLHLREPLRERVEGDARLERLDPSARSLIEPARAGEAPFRGLVRGFRLGELASESLEIRAKLRAPFLELRDLRAILLDRLRELLDPLAVALEQGELT